MSDDSEIVVSKSGGMSFNGPDAVNLFRAATLWSSLRLYAQSGIIPTRGFGAKKMLAAASSYTGKKYRASKPECERAAADLKVWMDTMKSALPIRRADDAE